MKKVHKACLLFSLFVFCFTVGVYSLTSIADWFVGRDLSVEVSSKCPPPATEWLCNGEMIPVDQLCVTATAVWGYHSKVIEHEPEPETKSETPGAFWTGESGITGPYGWTTEMRQHQEVLDRLDAIEKHLAKEVP